MQKFCSLYQAQALEAFWVICHHCHALQCLHPLLATHKSCFQSNQTESWVSLAADFALWASGCLCVVCLCWSAGAWIVRVIDTSTGQWAELGLGYRTFCPWNRCGVPWAGRGQQPSHPKPLCSDLEVMTLLGAAGCPCSRKFSEGCMEDAPLLLATRQGSTGPCLWGRTGLVLSPVPCRQTFAMAS